VLSSVPSAAPNVKPIRRLLVANRGEIACRIMHTAQAMGIECIAVFSEADRNARHVRMANQAICIGAAPASQSYLNIEAIIAACQKSQADAVHPGYGFLSENADFAQACINANILFIGPTPEAMRALGNKAAAKKVAQQAGVALAPSYTGSLSDQLSVLREAQTIGYPIMVKAAAGGGGRGMRLVTQAADLAEAIASAQREAMSSFGSDQVFLERAILNARHIEIQIIADQHGNCFSLGERDCSTQRKNQKIIEEAPAPGLAESTRKALCKAAIQLSKAANYYGAGTVEFLVEQKTANPRFYFLEVNTRLQVEHPVTEALLGLNLVELQLQVAQRQKLQLDQQAIDQRLNDCANNGGHAIELRLCAEDPRQGFAPQVGAFIQEGFDLKEFNLTHFAPHPSATHSVRIDSGLDSSGVISPWYDSMCTKLISYAPNRQSAIEQLLSVLQGMSFHGLQSNQHYLASLLDSVPFKTAQLHTRWLDEFNEKVLAKVEGQALSTPGQNLLLQAAAIFANEQSKQHGNLQGFGGFSSSIHLQCNETVRSVQVHCLSSGQFECSVDNQSNKLVIDIAQVKPVWLGRQLWLQTHLTQRLEPTGYLFKQLAYKPNLKAINQAAGGDVTSTMHGKVNQVLVAVGAQVSRGDTLITIEAMKMEHHIQARVDGVVQAVAVEVGQQVSPSQLLITLSSTKT
jgi:geranyl-CoA carboxylase alpha subunit